MLALSAMTVVSVPVQSIRPGIRRDDGGTVSLKTARSMAEGPKVSQ